MFSLIALLVGSLQEKLWEAKFPSKGNVGGQVLCRTGNVGWTVPGESPGPDPWLQH